MCIKDSHQIEHDRYHWINFELAVKNTLKEVLTFQEHTDFEWIWIPLPSWK